MVAMTRAERSAKFRRDNPRYYNEYQRQAYARHTVMLRIIKQEMGCIDCGYNADPVALDFDHVRGEKRFNLAKIAFRGVRTIQAELEKCVVRCANCHRIRSAQHV
jgi:hypothetical protein